MDEIDQWDLPWGLEGMVKSNHMIEHNRWSIWHEIVFRAPDDGKLWRLHYQVPATEMQECDRWPDLEAVQVELHLVQVETYQVVSAANGDTP